MKISRPLNERADSWTDNSDNTWKYLTCSLKRRLHALIKVSLNRASKVSIKIENTTIGTHCQIVPNTYFQKVNLEIRESEYVTVNPIKRVWIGLNLFKY